MLADVPRLSLHTASAADLRVLVLLVVAEENVAVVDFAVDGDDVDGAEAAFAALAVGHHLVAGGVEHVEHRALARDLEFEVRP